MTKKEFVQSAEKLLTYINASPTAAHAVETSAEMLKKAGFKEIKENAAWKLKKGDKFYIIRHETSLIAGIMGEKPAENGFKIIGSHTDSPGFKLKAKSLTTNNGFLTLSLEVYGGPIYSSWQDREVALAGKVIVKKGDKYTIKLVDLKETVFAFPQVSVHYNRDVNTASAINPQNQLIPLLGQSSKPENDDLVAEMIAKKLKIKKTDIVNYELTIYAVQPGNIGGLDQEFIYSGRIDNLGMAQASLEAILNAPAGKTTKMIALFDNEEVGSSTNNGANSSFMKDVLLRLSSTDGNIENYFRAIANSFFVSADGAHSVHPGYQEKFDSLNRVFMNQGPAIKINANTGYASTAESIGYFELVCQKAGIPYQKFVNRADIRGGGTIGSMIATNLGILTVDIGNPMLAMHSARETCGTADHYYMTKVLTQFMAE